MGTDSPLLQADVWVRGRDYRRGHQLGKGGFGVVYECINLQPRDVGRSKLPRGALFAEKVVDLPFKEDKQRINDLANEIRVLAELDHPHIVHYYGASLSGKSRDRFHLFMEYVPGGPLTDIVRQFGLLSEVVVQTYTEQILEALDYLHSCGYVHRDLKASNILISTSSFAKVTDFGTCHKISTLADGMAVEDRQTGTPFFFPPERMLERKIGPQTDIWAVGCVALEMLNGRTPFSTGTNYMQVAYRLGSGEVPQVPKNASELLQDFISQCFKPAEDRPSASSLLKHDFITEMLAVEEDYVDTSDEEGEREMRTLDQTFTFAFTDESNSYSSKSQGTAPQYRTLPSNEDDLDTVESTTSTIKQRAVKAKRIIKCGLHGVARLIGLGTAFTHLAYFFPGRGRSFVEPVEIEAPICSPVPVNIKPSFTCKTIMKLLGKAAPAVSYLTPPSTTVGYEGGRRHPEPHRDLKQEPLEVVYKIPRAKKALLTVIGILTAAALVELILFLKESRKTMRGLREEGEAVEEEGCSVRQFGKHLRGARLADIEAFIGKRYCRK